MMADQDSKSKDGAQQDMAAIALPSTPSRNIPSLDDASIKALAAEMFRLQQDAAKAGPGTAVAPALPTLPAEVVNAKLRPAFSFLANILKIPQSELMTKIDEKLTEGGIKVGVTLAVGLVAQVVRPTDMVGNAELAGFTAGVLSGPLSNFAVKMVNKLASHGVDKLHEIQNRQTPALESSQTPALPAPEAAPAPEQAGSNLVVMPAPQPAATAKLRIPAA